MCRRVDVEVAECCEHSYGTYPRNCETNNREKCYLKRVMWTLETFLEEVEGPPCIGLFSVQPWLPSPHSGTLCALIGPSASWPSLCTWWECCWEP